MQEAYMVVTGRPNAGKSSLIKRIVGINVVRGKHPGTTRGISTYPLAQNLKLVDMPGFGSISYGSKYLAHRLNNQIVNFLQDQSENIVLAIHVLDISLFLEVTRRLEKKGIISVDVEMTQFLAKTMKMFPLVAANKIDKASPEMITRNLQEFKARVSSGFSVKIDEHVYPVSMKRGDGLGSLKNAIIRHLTLKGYKTPLKHSTE